MSRHTGTNFFRLSPTPYINHVNRVKFLASSFKLAKSTKYFLLHTLKHAGLFLKHFTIIQKKKNTFTLTIWDILVALKNLLNSMYSYITHTYLYMHRYNLRGVLRGFLRIRCLLIHIIVYPPLHYLSNLKALWHLSNLFITE